MMKSEKVVGQIKYFEYDQDTGELNVMIEVLDEEYKQKIVHNEEYNNIIIFKNKSVISLDEDK